MCDLPTFAILVTLSYSVISDDNIVKMYFLDPALPKAPHNTIFPHHTDSMSWPHHHEVTVLSQYDVDNTVAEHTTWSHHSEDTVVSQVFAHTVRSLWCHFDIPIMPSHVWVVCEVTVTQVEYITVRSQCCHSIISKIHEMTTSPWGHSVVTAWCHRYTQWPHHHEVTVLSQDDAQCTLWGHYDVLMISKLWHHMCEMFVRSQWEKFTTLCCHIVMSQIHEMTTSPWVHSVVTNWCSPCGLIMMSLWYRNCDITRVTCLWGHCDMSLPHHHEVIALSQCDDTDIRDDHIIMRSQCCHRTMLAMWDHYDIKIMTSPVWDFCEVTVIQVEHITSRSQCCHNMMWQVLKVTTSPWGHSAVTWRCSPYDVTMMSSWYQNVWDVC